MAKKVQIDGNFNRQQCKEFIEDIANTENVTVISVNVTPVGINLFNVFVLYDDGVEPASVQAFEDDIVEDIVEDKKGGK